ISGGGWDIPSALRSFLPGGQVEPRLWPPSSSAEGRCEAMSLLVQGSVPHRLLAGTPGKGKRVTEEFPRHDHRQRPHHGRARRNYPMHCFPHGVRACSFVPTVCMPNAGSGTLISASRALLIGSDSWVMGDQETSCISIHLRGRPVALVVDALTASWKGL